MKVIKYISYILLLLIFASSCEEELDMHLKTYDGPSFVRFFVLLNSDGQPLTMGTVNNSTEAAHEITINGFGQLKIPVLFTTAKPISDTVKVKFEVIDDNDTKTYNLEPAEEVCFTNGKYSDTITLSFNRRWSDTTSFVLKLTESNSPDVNIGHLNDSSKNNALKINLAELETPMSLSKNKIELIGDMGESVKFSVVFPKGLFANEINVDSLFDIVTDFGFVLDNEPFDDFDEAINFTLTLTDSIKYDELTFTALVSLRESDLYKISGISELVLNKPSRTNRDKYLNTAANFYNLNDQYYRTYGDQWLANIEGECDWRSFNAFTFPVIVPKNHGDAILYDDKGTADESDDIYHHAFKIGFKATLVDRTTNSFNLKRWFSDESTDIAVSPGFNITDAIEFFPSDGTSDSSGTIKIVEQTITLTGRKDGENGKSFNFDIAWEGSYKRVNNEGLFEISFELRLFNQELFGGWKTGYYRLYNNKTYPDPDPIENTDCIREIELYHPL